MSGGCEVEMRYVCSNLTRQIHKYRCDIYQYCAKIDHDAPYKDILPYKEYHTTPYKDILPYKEYIRRNTMC